MNKENSKNYKKVILNDYYVSFCFKCWFCGIFGHGALKLHLIYIVGNIWSLNILIIFIN